MQGQAAHAGLGDVLGEACWSPPPKQSAEEGFSQSSFFWGFPEVKLEQAYKKASSQLDPEPAYGSWPPGGFLKRAS